MKMNDNLYGTHEAPDQRRGLRSRSIRVLISFVAIVAYFLFTRHRAHVMDLLPFLLLAACPLMHLFNCRHGHGSHGGASDRSLILELKPRSDRIAITSGGSTSPASDPILPERAKWRSHVHSCCGNYSGETRHQVR